MLSGNKGCEKRCADKMQCVHVHLLFSEALGGGEAMLYDAARAACAGTQDLELVLLSELSLVSLWTLDARHFPPMY